jgi:hypothetical protein
MAVIKFMKSTKENKELKVNVLAQLTVRLCPSDVEAR